MAISKMAKVMIISHRSEATELLETLQHSGMVQILNAEQAMVTKTDPDLAVVVSKSKETEDTLAKLDKCIEFLKPYADMPKGLIAALSPLTVVEKKAYNDTVSDEHILQKVTEAVELDKTIERLKNKIENTEAALLELTPWRALNVPVEEISQLDRTDCIAGLIPNQYIEAVKQQLGDIEAAIDIIGQSGNKTACVIVCLNEKTTEIQKFMRSVDFESMSFESMTGTISEVIDKKSSELNRSGIELEECFQKAAQSAKDIYRIQILFDHYNNLLDREHTKASAPATEQTVILEGWVRNKDNKKLEKLVSKFSASSLSEIEPGEDEDIPVEIENNSLVKPFEIVTRLYGMPQHFEVDPTAFLAPFFALFFGLCLTDAGYGFLMIAASIFLIKKTQGDKKFAYLFLMCSILTVICGALTGSWFGDAIQLINIGWLNTFRAAILKYGFDPMEKPMMFFAISLTIGYFQLLFGIAVAFIHKLRQKNFISAVCDHLTWLVMLNCLALYGFSRSQTLLSAEQGAIALKIAAVPAAVIFLFSHRQGNIVARLGMGFYNLASTIFYIGDILSYVRLMALGMVTAGFAGAINQMALMAGGMKFIGPVIAVVVLIGGHLFNLAISALGSFVHSLRLQYVEFFPKFFDGGGRLFQPFAKINKYIYIKEH